MSTRTILILLALTILFTGFHPVMLVAGLLIGLAVSKSGDADND